MLLRAALVLCALILADQLALFFLLGDGWFLGRRIAPFDPPLFTRNQVRSLERIEAFMRHGSSEPNDLDFDSDLGWSHARNLTEGPFTYDWSGSRIAERPLATQRRNGVLRIAAYGCSFVLGTEVGPMESWPAQLDAAGESLEVANLGMAAYGLDQAFLRWRRDGAALHADEVWLGFLPSAALRNLTLYWPAAHHWASSVAFKPRFRLDEHGELVLLANPAPMLSEFCRLLRNQSAFVEAVGDHDAFVRRRPQAYAPEGAHWSHFSAVGRLGLTLLERGGRDSSRELSNPRSETFRLVAAIVRAMRSSVEADGHRRFRLVVLPGREDLAHRARTGEGYWQPLIEHLRDPSGNAIETWDLSEELSPCLEDDSFWAREGHYSPRANQIVAGALFQRLTSSRKGEPPLARE